MPFTQRTRFAQDESLEIPDFRVVLDTGESMLIEAKNYHQMNSPTKGYRMKKAYLEGLEKYAALTKCRLGIALYWSKWNFWTLTPPDAFLKQGDWVTIELEIAMKRNCMALLGDKHIGTKMPLKYRFDLEHVKMQTKRGSTSTFSGTIKGVSMSCAGYLIEDETEKRIAHYLMLFGKLEERSQPVFDGNLIIAIEHEYRSEEDSGQGFTIVDSLSSMFSRFYRHATAAGKKGRVKQIHAKSTPGALGKLIPEGYKGKALPLWIFELQPNDKPDGEKNGGA